MQRKCLNVCNHFYLASVFVFWAVIWLDYSCKQNVALDLYVFLLMCIFLSLQIDCFYSFLRLLVFPKLPYSIIFLFYA